MSAEILGNCPNCKGEIEFTQENYENYENYGLKPPCPHCQKQMIVERGAPLLADGTESIRFKINKMGKFLGDFDKNYKIIRLIAWTIALILGAFVIGIIYSDLYLASEDSLTYGNKIIILVSYSALFKCSLVVLICELVFIALMWLLTIAWKKVSKLYPKTFQAINATIGVILTSVTILFVGIGFVLAYYDKIIPGVPPPIQNTEINPVSVTIKQPVTAEQFQHDWDNVFTEDQKRKAAESLASQTGTSAQEQYDFHQAISDAQRQK